VSPEDEGEEGGERREPLRVELSKERKSAVVRQVLVEVKVEVEV